MIAYIKGTIKYRSGIFFVLENSGIGYKIFAPDNILLEIKENTEREFYTHQYVREDAINLYGFNTREELDFFELLISISGIGPKSALGILSVAPAAETKKAIANGDLHLLTKVSGIGRKTAERVILELKEKIASFEEKTNGGKIDAKTFDGQNDVIEALMRLGYSSVQARDTLKQIPSSVTEVGQKVKEALKILGKR